MADYGLLAIPAEDELHKQRYFNLDLRPLKRVSDRMLAKNDNPSYRLGSKPVQVNGHEPNGDDLNEAAQESASIDQKALARWKQDILLDFSAFDSNLIRAQNILTSNELERERYETKKIKITEETELARQSIIDLRVKLQDAQATLTLRKTYDAAADKILSNKMLRTREEQAASLEKLNTEIADLEKEAEDYAQTWSERRQQFGKIVDEGLALRRQIQGEKEEEERKEGMQSEDIEKGEQSEPVTQKHSREGTPAPPPPPPSADGEASLFSETPAQIQADETKDDPEKMDTT